MLEMVFIFCLVAGDGECQTVRSDYAGPSLMMCMHDAMAESAKWVGTHPGYYMKIAKCGPRSKDA